MTDLIRPEDLQPGMYVVSTVPRAANVGKCLIISIRVDQARNEVWVKYEYPLGTLHLMKYPLDTPSWSLTRDEYIIEELELL